MLKNQSWDQLVDRLQMTRRTFLKVSAATCGALAVGSLTACEAEDEVVENPYDIPKVEYEAYTTEGKFYHTTCPRNCHDTCSIKTQVKDGKIISVTGNQENPYTAGNLCVKMNNYINYQYDPNRLLYPMKRTGKKGEGKFKRISWDEAYAAIVENTKENLDKYGPNSIAQYFYSGTLGFVSNYSIPMRYFNKLGATGCDGTICLATGKTTIPYTYGKEYDIDPEQYANTKLYISWGTNESATGVHQVKFIKQCQLNGGKVVVINTTPTPVSNFADLFIRIKPGTDAAFALGVMNVMINEEIYDKAFVEANTFGFDKLKERVQDYPVAKVAEITGASVEQIEEFARLYASTNPAILRMGYGLQRHTNGGSMVRAITFLPALTGNLGKENAGYTFFNQYTWDVNWDVVYGTDLITNKNKRILNMISLGKDLNGLSETTQKEPIKQLFVYVANPMTSTPQNQEIRKGLERKDLFTIVHDVFHTDTVDYADIVLPSTTLFEQEDLNQGYLSYYLSLTQKAVEPLGEAKSNIQLFSELSTAMGFDDKALHMNGEELIKEIISTGGNLYQQVDYNELVEKGFVRINPEIPYADRVYPTPSGKIEFYSESIEKDWGLDPIASYVPELNTKEDQELAKKYPLKFLTLSTKNLLNGQLSNLPHIQALIGDEVIFMHPEDAYARELQSGDKVKIMNERGYCELTLQISDQKVLPGVVLAYKSPWAKLLGGRNINATTSNTLSDIGGGSTFHSNLVEVKKA